MEQSSMFDDEAEAGVVPPGGVKKPMNVTVAGEGGPGNKMQGWIQTEKLATDFMWQIGKKNGTCLPLLMYLVAKMNRGSGAVLVSLATIAKDLEVTQRTVSSALALLKQCNFVQVLKSGNANVYVINSSIAWSGRRGERFATFSAQIRVAEAEQEKPVEELEIENSKLLPVPQIFGGGDLNWDVIEMPGGKPPSVGESGN